MIKKIPFIIFYLVPLVIHAMEEKSAEKFPTMCLQENSKVLQKATDRYLNFISQISAGKTSLLMETAAEILAPNCRKILNGQLFTQNRESFVNDLLSVYKNQGRWKVYPADTIIDPSMGIVVLRIFIEMENLGKYTAMVILRYDSSYLITEINEVINQVKGSYDF